MESFQKQGLLNSAVRNVWHGLIFPSTSSPVSWETKCWAQKQVLEVNTVQGPRTKDLFWPPASQHLSYHWSVFPPELTSEIFPSS